MLRDQSSPRPVATRRPVHHGMVFDVARDTVDFAPGVRFDREYVVHTGAVAVLAVDQRDGAEHVLMIRQYRHPARHLLWEIPAGLLDQAGEEPYRAALRELTEETGHEASPEAGRLRTLVDLRPSPGASDETIRVLLATEVRPATAPTFEATDEEAELEVQWVPLTEVVTAALDGRVTNATAVAAVLALAAHRARGDGDEALRPADAPWPAGQ